jgi:hypothetical protein
MFPDLIEQGRRVLLTQGMTGGVIHLLVACLGVDGKQLVHQLNDAHRRGILLVELDRIHKVPSRMSPTCVRKALERGMRCRD